MVETLLKTSFQSHGSLALLSEYSDILLNSSSISEVIEHTILFFQDCAFVEQTSCLVFEGKGQNPSEMYHVDTSRKSVIQRSIDTIPNSDIWINPAIQSQDVLLLQSSQEVEFTPSHIENVKLDIAIPVCSKKQICLCMIMTLVVRRSDVQSWKELTRNIQNLMHLSIQKHIDQKFTNAFKVRTRKLFNAKVQELKTIVDKARRSNQSLKDFSYTVSHDLREPLRTINSYISFIERKYFSHLDEEAKELFHFVTDGASRMDRLINDLLKFSRIENSTFVWHTVSLDQVLEETIAKLALKIEESNCSIESDGLSSIIASKTHIGIVFQNIIDNAIKFKKDDIPPKIELSINDIGHYWQIDISDNGIGMNLEHHNDERIFKIFQRLQTFGSKYPGTGIGLAIVKNIIENHGGQIWVNSQEGVGSTFSFTIPKSLVAGEKPFV